MPEIKSEVLRPLAALDHIRRGPAAYYFEVARSEDPYVAVGAWRALMSGNHLASRPDCWVELVEMCRYGALKGRTFEFFESEVFEHELAARVAKMDANSLLKAMSDRMQAELGFDGEAAVDAAAQIFLAGGDMTFLTEAYNKAELLGGSARSLPWLVRLLVIEPRNPDFHRCLLDALDNAGNGELLSEYGQILTSVGLFPKISQVVLADAAYHKGDAKRCVELVSAAESIARSSATPLPMVKPPLFQIKARAEEKLGLFKDAFRDFAAMKASAGTLNFDPEDFFRRTAAKKQLRVPLLPADPRSDVVQMLGFPRSGTTLLENALAAHPEIETFEEIESFEAAIDMIEFAIRGMAPPATPVDMYLRARSKYYEEIDIRRRKPGAKVLIDKLPIRSSEADFISKVFPDWRFIFSIRNPYDVVLSCFKQRFFPNPAMENFRTIERAVRAYDHTMSEWFAVHSLDDPDVHCVRYDELVTDFDRVMAGTLDFLGLRWEDSVRDFATAAQGRGTRTPSYAKVRQGIGIGVQTYWRDYRFVFDTEAAKPLRKWAEFFGYEI